MKLYAGNENIGASIILVCLLIFVIAGVITSYLKSRKVELDKLFILDGCLSNRITVNGDMPF
jgi:hypothetical protein